MPIQVVWDNPQKTIIRQIFEGKWEVNDFHQVIDATKALLHDVSYRVDIIQDFSQASRNTPADLLGGLQRMERFRHSFSQTRGLMLVVAAPIFIKTLVAMSRKHLPDLTDDMHFFDTLAEAYSLLEKP